MVPEIVMTLVISPILQEALSRATSFAVGEITRDRNLKEKVEELEKSLTKMRSLLEAAEEMVESDDNIVPWLQDLGDLAYELVDLLDEYDYDVKKQVHARVPDFLSLFSRRMAKKIKKIEESLDRGVNIMGGLDVLFKRLSCATREQYDDNSETFREEDFLKIKGSLTQGSREHPLFGLAIVGMPGVGKTTLARSIEKWAEEGNFYDLVAWVTVPKKFDEKEILGVMLEYLDRRAGGLNSFDAILHHLRKLLRNQNFLLILDDFYDELDEKTWGRFISRLSSNFKTSRISIVVTTSNKKVASTMDAVGCNRKIGVHMLKHELQKLSNAECWSIMEEKVLSSSNLTSIEDPELLATGQEIAERCGGLPLVADVIGEAMSECVDVVKWLAIRDNTTWVSPPRKEILSKLKKSFDRLSSPLKKCFSYCSIFPEGYEIRRDELVQLWMAKGFLYQHNGSKSDKQEDVGDKYLNDLVSNFFLQDVKLDGYGNIKSCKMHSQMHNLALFLSKHETYVWPNAHSIEECSSIRHMRVGSTTNFPAIPADVPQRLHSLFLDVDILNDMASKLKSLRSLKLVAAKTERLGASLEKSKYYIKYLDISKIDIQGLPEPVTKLYNLQTLRVPGCQSLKKLPRDIECLVSLRHIYFDDERHMPRRIGRLTSLQTLPLFVVGTKEGRKIEELEHLNQLRGKLKICNLELVISSAEAAKAKLEEKVNLIKLQFVWSERTANNNNDMDVLKGLQPNSNLKNVTIKNYKGSNFPSWMVKGDTGSDASFRLNSLVKLKLINCDECGNISSLGLLPQLKVLTIRAMSKVKNIVSNHDRSNVASSSRGGGESIKLFPALRNFKLTNMKRLEGWTEVQSKLVFPCLEELHIQDCPELKFYHNRSNMANSSQGGGESNTLFPALRKLTLCEMKTLEEWTEVQGTAVFPYLEELHIQDCPELQTWRIDRSISHKLSMLSIQSCVNLQVITVGQLNLKSLNINNCPKLLAYAKEGSQEWSTIRHIGSTRINGQVV